MPTPPSTYPAFFQDLTGFPPYPYQERLAAGEWPQLLDVPTGLGKTAAVVVAWLHRLLAPGSSASRRLVYCLPMRVLVEQTAEAARLWCERAQPYFEERDLATPTVHLLMGGDLDEQWERRPEHPALLVGTQDMLLSRGLNRGYGMSRYRWPVHFGLLHGDSLWVYDETQLMGVGVETGAQLQGLRQKLGAWGESRSLWMSATLGRRQLATVDHPEPPGGWRLQSLTDEDRAHPEVLRRTNARKALASFPDLALSKETAAAYAPALAARVAELHAARGGLTLVIVNRVDRAQEIYQALLRQGGRSQADTALVHARFRRDDRRRHEALLGAAGDRIVVATQAVEAGVDVSARTLVTELAPWPSLVQRLGRLNRGGEAAGAQAWWVDLHLAGEADPLALPYDAGELAQARQLLGRLAEAGGDAGPASLATLTYQPPPVVRPVLRRRDLLDLFDTTPDLCGEDLDVSRFIRDGEDTDLLVYWRAFEGTSPPAGEPAPDRDELCRVSLPAARGFLADLTRHQRRLRSAGAEAQERSARLTAWSWNPLDATWQEVIRPRPGQAVLLHPEAGGYHPALGWTGEVAPAEPVAPVPPPEAPLQPASLGDDNDSARRTWVLLRDHLRHVLDEAEALAAALDLPEPHRRALVEAARWHDVGKAHEAFQGRFLAPGQDDPEARPPGPGPWAKSALQHLPPGERRTFRHELASALAWRAVGEGSPDGPHPALVAYLIAAHHGKVRLSIRSIPGETEPPEPERLFARGVWDGDPLPAVELPGGLTVGPLTLDLAPMQMGEGSWLESTLALRDDPALGPFRLAFLEALLRIADWRASAREEAP